MSRRRGLLATLFPDSFPTKPKVRKKKTNGQARANIVARQNRSIYTSSGMPGPTDMSTRTYRRSKRVWPG